MNIFRCIIWFGVLMVATGPAQAERAIQPLNEGWRFALGEHVGAEAMAWDDAQWRQLDLPHDWAMEGPYSSDAVQGDKGGYRPGGIGWYRRAFDIPTESAGRRLRVEFDGAYMNSEVWVNGHHLGRRPYGYISFGYDLTPYLQPGRNVLAVRLDNSREPSARWYHGCGLYAPVRLISTGDVHVMPSGVQVVASSLAADSATVEIKTDVTNQSEAPATVRLRTTVLDPAGNEVASDERKLKLAARGEALETQILRVPAPQRWDIDTPVLYTAVTEIRAGGQVTDTVRTRFGLREIKWDVATGFWLNGRNVKLLGVAEHLEGGPVGAAWPDALIRWKLKLLKDMGCNAVRTAHNPQVPRFYEICDEMGILVMDEIFDGWRQKAPQDYGKQAFAEWWQRDLRDWLRRDRNHPSIVILSVGNETQGSEAAAMVQLCHELDPTRPVTSGHSGSEHMDVFGVNGHSERQAFFSEVRPAKPFVATEAPHTWQVRGYYRTRTWYRDGFPNKNQDPFPLPDLTPTEIFNYDWIAPKNRPNPKQIFNSSYDNAMVRITARQNWTLMRDLPWFSGHFRWTGWDYLGEAGYVHGGWPFRAFMGGAIDLAGFPKDLYYFYQSQWTSAPMVHLLPHWTHPRMKPGTPIPVWAYTNAEEVELLLNGHSLGRRRPGKAWDQLQCEWLVPWAPGTLEAVAYRAGREVARTVQRTATAPSQLQVTTERLSAEGRGRDLAIVTVAAADADGTFYPYGESRVGFHADGPARILSLENGNPVDTDPNLADSRRMFFGLTRAFVELPRQQDGGSVVVGAICGEKRQLTSDQVSIEVSRVDLRTGVTAPEKSEIRYTLDDSEPTRSSLVYTGPFHVPLGITVRALVLAGGSPLMRLTERFGSDEGLHWGSGGEPVSPPVFGDQAESARFEGAVIGHADAGFSGTGYLDFTDRPGFVEWYQENDGAAAPYRLIVRFSSATNGGRVTLSVNEQEPTLLVTTATNQNQKIWMTTSTVRTLQSGANHIRLKIAGEGGTKIDELIVVPATETVIPASSP